ncbi:hypothetical protein K2173_023140 [Erythroxylum novogranatense]|uniref:Peptidase S8/S53 domain-containing protein n=1 Tax=Erythroxylum novogranatense TaxID=1862640 RepID=A0AAV8U7W8_9ROSI|nr:hypothetical protein K2173_023140 [Erythroxylum novogranatense]
MKLGSYDFVTNYALISSTSMVAPHVAGLGSNQKVHPEWSPSAIRSAPMTIAYVTITQFDNKRHDDREATTPLDFGSGHVNPNKAIDPGLIYDIDFQGYVEFICGPDTPKAIRALIGKAIGVTATNPSLTILLSWRFDQFKWLSHSEEIYQICDLMLEMATPFTDQPSSMFRLGQRSRKFQKRSYTLSLEIERKRLTSDKSYAFLQWSDQHNHVVSSPILVAEWTRV